MLKFLISFLIFGLVLILKCKFQAYLESKFCNPLMFYFEDIRYSEAQGKSSNCQSNLFCQQSECNFSNFTVLHSVRKGFHFKTNLKLSIKKDHFSSNTENMWVRAQLYQLISKLQLNLQNFKTVFPFFPFADFISLPSLVPFAAVCVYVVGPTPSTTVVADSPDSI